MKLPLHERPPVETMRACLQVRPDLLRLFAVDLQNDCACDTEVYDWDPARPLVVWKEGAPERRVMTTHRLSLPIGPGTVTDDIVERMIDAAGMNEAALHLHGFLNYGTITVNLRGWGAFCYVPG